MSAVGRSETVLARLAPLLRTKPRTQTPVRARRCARPGQRLVLPSSLRSDCVIGRADVAKLT